MGDEFWSAWEQWFLGNALASVILTPLILYWVIGGWQAVRSQTLRVRLEALLAFAGLAVSAFFAFGNKSDASYPSPIILYAPVPFLLWIAVRLVAWRFNRFNCYRLSVVRRSGARPRAVPRRFTTSYPVFPFRYRCPLTLRRCA